MSASLRKLGLTAHVLASVGWLGAVAAFLALAIVGLTSGNGPKAIAAYLAMDGITRSVIVPFCVASLITGIIQSLGTPWGLVRYYWVLLKLGLTVSGTVGLLLHTQAIRYAAGMAATGSFGADADQVRVQLVLTAGAAIVLLFVATVLSVYKPRGLTPYGLSKQKGQSALRCEEIRASEHGQSTR
jgi:hypothetical protein